MLTPDFPLSGIPFLNPFHTVMDSQLKDLGFWLKKIGGVQVLDSGKRKKNFDSRFLGHDTGSTGPVENLVVTETVRSAKEDPEVVGEPLNRRRTDLPVADIPATTVVEGPYVSGPSASVAALQTLKDWISSIPAAHRRHELFDNYTSPQEKRKFKRESFDGFVGTLTDKVTLVSEFT